jgi:hypothetical protein
MNNPEENKQSLSEIMISKIKTGEIKMKPRFYFVLKGLLLGLGLAFTLLASFFLVGMIIFMLRHNGLLLLPQFGFKGIRILIDSLPWFLLIIAILFIIVLEFFAKHYKFVYQKPTIYSIVIVTILVLLGGTIFMGPAIHNRLLGNKMICPIYGKANLKDMHIGQVIKVNEEDLTLKLRSRKTVIVKTEMEKAQEGEWFVIIGREDNGVIDPKGIKKIDLKRDGGLIGEIKNQTNCSNR